MIRANFEMFNLRLLEKENFTTASWCTKFVLFPLMSFVDWFTLAVCHPLLHLECFYSVCFTLLVLILGSSVFWVSVRLGFSFMNLSVLGLVSDWGEGVSCCSIGWCIDYRARFQSKPRVEVLFLHWWVRCEARFGGRWWTLKAALICQECRSLISCRLVQWESLK